MHAMNLTEKICFYNFDVSRFLSELKYENKQMSTKKCFINTTKQHRLFISSASIKFVNIRFSWMFKICHGDIERNISVNLNNKLEYRDRSFVYLLIVSENTP